MLSTTSDVHLVREGLTCGTRPFVTRESKSRQFMGDGREPYGGGSREGSAFQASRGYLYVEKPTTN